MPQATALFKNNVQAILNMAKKQLAAAEAQQWDEVESLEKHRQQLIRQCFAATISPAMADLARLAIKKIKASEAQLMTVVNNGQNQTRDELNKLQKGNKVTRAYKELGQP